MRSLLLVHSVAVAVLGVFTGPDARADLKKFAYASYLSLAQREGSPTNVVYSPASAGATLALLREGASGTTRAELDRLLGISELPGGREQFVSAKKALGALGIEPGASFRAATALWVDKSTIPNRGFVDTVSTDYGVRVKGVDFSAPAKASAEINAWVAAETQQQIPKLLGPRQVDRVSLLSTTALYFRGQWKTPFPKAKTRLGDFRLLKGRARVPLMHARANLKFLANPLGPTDPIERVVELPLAGDELSMLLLLPRKPGLKGLEEAERRLAVDERSVISGRWSVPVALVLPRLKLEFSADLSDALKAQGVKSAFVPEADFSGLASGQGLVVGGLVQKARLIMDESGNSSGAVAPAATTAGSGASERKERLSDFRADRPFLFVLRHLPTGAVLFVGRVVDPR